MGTAVQPDLPRPKGESSSVSEKSTINLLTCGVSGDGGMIFSTAKQRPFQRGKAAVAVIQDCLVGFQDFPYCADDT